MIETEILIIGGGASGLTASLLLSAHGMESMLVSKYKDCSTLPKAHLLSMKTMEIYRELGLEEVIRARSCPPEQMRYVAWFAGLKGRRPEHGREIARLGAWGRGSEDDGWRAASNCLYANVMQAQLEPLLRATAEASTPGNVRFHHELKSFREEAAGVVALITNRDTGQDYEIRARYLLACDGGQSVGPALNIPMRGHTAIATTVSVHFEADLSAIARAPDVLIRTILNPDTGLPGVLVPMGPERWGPDSEEWVFHMLSFPGDHKLMDDETALAQMQATLGLEDVPVRVRKISRWPLNASVSERLQAGRVFILGDAAHRMPPSGGHGLNMAVQDVYNLCWKLAAVLRGQAGPKLLESYEPERQPVAEMTVGSAFANWGNAKRLAAALGVSPENTAEQNWAALRRQWAEGPEGDAARRSAAEGLAMVVPTYSHIGVNFGYAYEQGALVPDNLPAPQPLDPHGDYRPSTKPGHTLPHAWVENTRGRTSLYDLAGKGRFLLIAGEDGEAWCEAARALAAERGLALEAITIGRHKGDWLDYHCEWLRLREFGPTGAILVRPDRYVAWRAMAITASPAASLSAALARILPA